MRVSARAFLQVLALAAGAGPFSGLLLPGPASAEQAPAAPRPETSPLYDPLGGIELRNPPRMDLAQCSLWQGGPAGTLIPPGMVSPPVPPQRLPGFATLDAQLTWRPMPNASITVGVENLLDRRYREAIERTDIDDPFTVNPRAPGRSLFARAAFQF